MKITAIVAVDKNGGMGVENRLLCHLPEDLKFFKRETLGKTVVMGRLTYESIGKPLPGRKNIILSRQSDYNPHQGCEIINSIQLCIEYLKNTEENNEIFIVGGASIFKQTVDYWDKILLTVIEHEFPEADAFFPNFEDYFNNNASGWNTKKKLLSHSIDERHKFAFSTYEICRDRTTIGKQTVPNQFSLGYV